jgi:hypothetical protein
MKYPVLEQQSRDNLDGVANAKATQPSRSFYQSDQPAPSADSIPSVAPGWPTSSRPTRWAGSRCVDQTPSLACMWGVWSISTSLQVVDHSPRMPPQRLGPFASAEAFRPNRNRVWSWPGASAPGLPPSVAPCSCRRATYSGYSPLPATCTAFRFGCVLSG